LMCLRPLRNLESQSHRKHQVFSNNAFSFARSAGRSTGLNPTANIRSFPTWQKTRQALIRLAKDEVSIPPQTSGLFQRIVKQQFGYLVNNVSIPPQTSGLFQPSLRHGNKNGAEAEVSIPPQTSGLFQREGYDAVYSVTKGDPRLNPTANIRSFPTAFPRASTMCAGTHRLNPTANIRSFPTS